MNYPDADPRRPRAEPEIIPPGRDDDRSRQAEAFFERFGDGYGTHRIYVAKPGLPSIIIGLLVLGAILAIGLFIFLGLVLLLPFLIGGVVLALIVGALARRGR